MMKSAIPCAAAALLLAACAGDNHPTQQSPGEPARFATSHDVKTGSASSFARGRIYRIERLDNAASARGEWRALGETIHQNGSTIEFTELGTGKSISFTAPHQVTATGSRADRNSTQGNSDIPGQGRNEVPPADQSLR